MDDLRSKIEHELDEMMMGAENFFGAISPKREGHIHCALDRIMALLNVPSGQSLQTSSTTILDVLKDTLETLEMCMKSRDPDWDGSATAFSAIGKARAILAQTTAKIALNARTGKYPWDNWTQEEIDQEMLKARAG